MPAGGSFSATALVTNAEAKSRFANNFAGLIMAAVIVLLGSAIGHRALPDGPRLYAARLSPWVPVL